MSILSRFLRRDKTEWATGASDSATPPDALTIEPMRRAHLPEILPIELTAYPQPWSQGVFQDELAMQARGSRHYLVAKLAGRIVGYGGMIYMDTAAHITNVAVDVAMRRRGIATELMLDLAWEARRAGMASLTLEVRQSECGQNIMKIVTTPLLCGAPIFKARRMKRGCKQSKPNGAATHDGSY